MKKIVAVSSFLSRNLTLVIIFTTLIALVIPEIFLPVAGIKIYNLSVPNLLLAVIMFGTGMSITFKDIIEIFKSPVMCYRKIYFHGSRRLSRSQSPWIR